MTDMPGKIRVQDAALANMVSIAAILEYLETTNPGSKDLIEARARAIARTLKSNLDGGPAFEEDRDAADEDRGGSAE